MSPDPKAMNSKPMSLKEALAFRMPGGKTLGEASPEDWDEVAEFSEIELERIAELDPATMTAEDGQRVQASLDRCRDFQRAMAAVRKHFSNPDKI